MRRVRRNVKEKNMLFNLLDSASSVPNSSVPNGSNPWGSWIMIGIFVVLMVVMVIFNKRNQKKREEESKALLESIRPGHKVKTIGGICGTVVEVSDEDNTFVLETGSETSGKSYMRFDKYAIAQTDAKKEENKQEEKKEN